MISLKTLSLFYRSDEIGVLWFISRRVNLVHQIPVKPMWRMHKLHRLLTGKLQVDDGSDVPTIVYIDVASVESVKAST